MTQTLSIPKSSHLTLPKRGMPVTIITGFLGSGKTTLLNHILTNNQQLKVAVLVNEFGDIDIDSQLLVSVDENMVALSNGCICCTINDNLVEAVYQILEQADKIDYLILETTGVADPLPIALTFINTELRDMTRLDSILTVVDAETFTPEHFESEAALRQIIYGDIILLNKTDLVDQEKLKILEEELNRIKSGARIIHSQHSQVPLPLILDIDVNNHQNYCTEHITDHHHHDHHHEHDHRHHHDHHHHDHDHLTIDGFVSISFESDRPFIVEKFQNFLVDDVMINVFRAKGIIWFKESQLRHIFQLSGKRYDMNADQWITSPRNQLVFIGRNLDKEMLTKQLNQCLA
ncbi:cobalamin synthesis protein P47K [Rippkaea orientalis PCC 8801]|uniref:Cobalamin synthesis protein P47K n=1 Tax=Rippkaea orientalis (strain PCC 8801 / RF-1) TaxID=41431 RepID=B7JYS3_RIPO1|nr:GTP-binding protein [Rippkaea orientalis]ACK64943.1 cobalamin synthesis protein P47K [Rippkaea orientalis PCC 8801]